MSSDRHPPHTPPSSEDAVAAVEILTRHIRGVNAASRRESAAPMIDGLAAECVMEFVGVPVGPFEGRDAIAAAYLANPPSSEVVLRDIEVRGGTVAAVYAWSHAPDVPAGRLTLEINGRKVTSMTIDYWNG